MIKLSEEQQKIAEIFYPYSMEKFLNIQEKEKKFVYYTSAESALKIIQSKEFWMRKTSCMNDYTEVQHGLECLVVSYKDDGKGVGEQFRLAINSIFPGISQEIEKLFDGWEFSLSTNSFIACVSEHHRKEDVLGRLSMWRAYAGSSGVAIVMNNEALLQPSDALGAYSFPVAYFEKDQFKIQIEKLAQNISAHADFVKSLGRENVKGYIFQAFKTAVLCTKHPGFDEELEWRVVHTPDLNPSTRLIKAVETIGGVPQPIYKVPLVDIPEENLVGIEIPELIHHIIIGPTDYPAAMADAFKFALTEAGATDVDNKVVVSSIPLR